MTWLMIVWLANGHIVQTETADQYTCRKAELWSLMGLPNSIRSEYGPIGVARVQCTRLTACPDTGEQLALLHDE